MAVNEYGEEYEEIIVSVQIVIDYELTIENEINHPDDLAKFRIQLENINTNFSAGPIENITVNLKLYTTHNNTEFEFFGALPFDTNILRTPEYVEANYTIIQNESLLPGEGIIVSGWLNSSISDIIVYYEWKLIIGVEVVFTSTGTINVYS